MSKTKKLFIPATIQKSSCSMAASLCKIIYEKNCFCKPVAQNSIGSLPLNVTRMSDSTLLLLDNNIFGSMCRNRDVANKFYSCIEKSFKGRKFVSLTTPFAAMEAAGITVPRINLEIGALDIKDKKSNDIFELIFNRALSIYTVLEPVSKAHLMNQAMRQEKYTCDRMKLIYKENVLDKLNQDSFVRDLHVCLALDQVYKFEYPADLLIDMHSVFYVDLFRAPHSGINAGMFRGMSKLWSGFTKTLEKNFPGEAGRLKDIQRLISLEAKSDYLDADLVHYACAGYFQDSRFHEVYAFTSDPSDSIKARCAVHSLLLREGQKMIQKYKDQSGEELPFSSHRFVPGIIGACSSAGNVLALHRTRKLPADFFPNIK